MLNRQFLDKLLQKLKVGDSRSIHLNALPGNFARLDIYDLINIEPSLHLKFMQQLLTKPSFTFSLTIDPTLATYKKKEEADIITKMVRRLNLMYYQEQDEFLEHGTKTFGFGFPLLIKRDPKNPAKIIKAPLFIWQLSLEKDMHRNNTWSIIRKEEEHPIVFNEMLRVHLEGMEQITMDELVNIADEGMLSEKAVLDASKLILSKLGVDVPEENDTIKILPGSDRISIEKITDHSPWIRWSGIFGLYKSPKQSIIQDMEKLRDDPAEIEVNTPFETFQVENFTPVVLDPSQEAVLNSLSATNKIIIQGPPGTGKSQTLTSLITNALYNQATCLVVCEKRTALEVIRQNLEKLGLGDMCVLIDDIYSDRKNVVERVRDLTDNPQQEPPIRINEYEKLHDDYSQLRKALNKQLGIVNNRFFGDDNWLDLVGWNLSLAEKVDEKILEKISPAQLELDYREYLELLKIIEEGEKLWKHAAGFEFACEMSETFYKLKPEEAFQLLGNWLTKVENLLDDHNKHEAEFGPNYTSLKGWNYLKTNIFGTIIGKLGEAKKARNNFLHIYSEIFEKWPTEPFYSSPLPLIEECESLSQLDQLLYNDLQRFKPVHAQQKSNITYISWRHFLANREKTTQEILLSLSKAAATKWTDAFTFWYTNKVLEKSARLYSLDENTQVIASELGEIEQHWRTMLVSRIRQLVYNKRRETWKHKDITYIKNLYNLRKNKQFGYRNSLRKIIHTDFEVFTSVFPVVLVNPGVCSSIMPLNSGIFDMVLLDEASQLRLEDTFTALLRGKSKVISGDKHQMPPSGFFQSQVAFMDLGEVNDEIEAEDAMVSGSLAESESLLEFAGDTDYHFTYLDFHYRSRHPDLIQFSNAAFYGSRLVPMPEKMHYNAIQYHAVNGLYDGKGTNHEEAEAVVKFLFEDLLPAQKVLPSVGVGTFNINQRNLIWDLITAYAYKDEAAATRLDNLLQAGLFVKNLENIQGDERDIMVLSTTFGPDEGGKFRQNFGPLTQAKGYQLLNVLVTRARNQVHIFTSFPITHTASYLEALQEKGNTGKGILYAYLSYAKAVSEGNVPMKEAVLTAVQQYSRDKSMAGKSLADKDRFRTWLVQHLQKNLSGYTITGDHAFGGFLLDIAILDETNTLKLAVECEGAFYHGGPEAYRYHLYRTQMLQQYDLPVFFAWSYNWWRNKNYELGKMKEILNVEQFAESNTDDGP